LQTIEEKQKQKSPSAMHAIDPTIRDQAYQFFTQESLEFLQTLEEGFLNLRHDHDVPKVHELMRAAHSIKGGAASVGLMSIQLLAHQLEDVVRSLYRQDLDIDLALEELLLQAYDCLRSPLVQQIQTGQHDGEAALLRAEPVFAQLTEKLGSIDENELPSAAELGVDIIQMIFSGDVSDGLARLERVLADPDHEEVAGEICAQADVFVGVGELTNLPGFVSIAKAAVIAIRQHPMQVEAIGQLALADFYAAQKAVLAGDRQVGGSPSAALMAWVAQPQAEEAADMDELAELATFFAETGFAETGFAETRFAETGFEDPLFAEPLEDPLVETASTDLDSLADLESLIDAPFVTAPVMNAPDAPVPDAPVPDASVPDAPVPDAPVPDAPVPDAPVTVLEPSFPTSDIPVSTLNVDAIEVAATDQSDSFQDLDQLFEGNPKTALTSPAASKPAASRYIDQYIKGNESLVTRLANRLQDTTNSAPVLSNTIRVDLERLERLNNLVGELVTQENGSILQNQNLHGMVNAVLKRFSRFEKITKDLQDLIDRSQNDQARLQDTALPEKTFDALQMDSYSSVHLLMQETVEEIAHLGEAMQDMAVLTQQGQQTQRKKQQTLKQVRNDLLWARMLPLGDLLQRFPRMVRDMSAKHNKQVSLTFSGATTLVDKAVLEKLFDPLVHLVRNAFDHGIESPEERLKQGKPAQGTIEILAMQRGNQTYIVVRDDGKGIDAAAIRAKAIALNLVSEAEAAEMSPDRLYEFIFAPGFSTAARVNELSGRGVGMDAVRSQIKRLKGDIVLASEPGKGTTFTLRLPLTLSIAKLLVFTVGDNTLALPIDTLISILTIPVEQIQTIQGSQFYRWQGQLLPLYPRSAFLQHYPLVRTQAPQAPSIPLPKKGKVPILLISGGAQTIALQVDQILQEQELVIKPFGSSIMPPSYFSGCTILGDGALVPVIDGQALVEQKRRTEFTPVRSVTNLLIEGTDDSSEASIALLDRPIAPAAPSSEPPSLNPFSFTQVPTVLVIDDSLTARQTLAFTLEKAGHRVLQARDGREALAQLHQTPVQAVFCDVEMPVMNGFEFLEQCRKEYPKAHLPIIMLTSRSGAKHRQIAELMGASAYLTKPFLEQELLGTLQTQLASR
jgi:two-component system, chemotaxis family, sensor histidine kinase and response regulator PixL